MKNERCPNCGGMLGVPDKLRGLPVQCPVCDLEFVPDNVASSKQRSTRSKKPSKPSLRSVPLPAAIASSATSSVAPSDTPTTRPGGSPIDDMLPPPRPRSTPPKSLESNPAAEKLDARPPEPPQPPGSVDDVESDGGASTAPDREPVTIGSKATEARQFAKVIKVESVLPKLTKDGKLPTLQLVEDGKPKPSDGEKSNPVLVGLLVCFSLLVSGAMLLVAGMDSSDSEKQIVESRARIRDFCEVRIEQEIAPYQLELRESQLAHSRGDVRAEIRNYEKVMARFHAEDRNRFKGITGSPTSDIELEEHVSRLLNAAKRKLKKGR